jgi:pimeloyl-ACP methyl ester carboxylesterase
MGDIRQSYRFLVPILVEAGFRVATMDIRGHGESSRDWPSYGQIAIGQDMVALVRHLGGPAIVIGQSFTPDSALVAASELPDQVAATVLIAPWARTRRPNPLMRLAQAACLRVPRLWCMFYSSLYPGTKPDDFATYLGALRASLSGSGGTRGLVAVADPRSRDAAAYRSRPAQPALIVMGERDPEFKEPRAEAGAMAADLSCPVEIAIIPAAGHYPQAQAPTATGAVIAAFLLRWLVAPRSDLAPSAGSPPPDPRG